MILTPLVPDRGEPVVVGADGARDRLRELYAPPSERWLRLNLVQSANGSAQGSDGTSDTLSSGADRAVLGAIRSLADVVLVGAQTLRAEGCLLPRRGRLAVLTASGELGTASAAPSRPGSRVLVLGPASAEDRSRATLTAAEVDFVALSGTDRVDPADAIDALRARGAESIVCEGGPGLAAQLIEAGLVDELCLSFSPKLAPGLPVLGDAPARDLELAALLADDAGGLYTRWLIPASRARS